MYCLACRNSAQLNEVVMGHRVEYITNVDAEAGTASPSSSSASSSSYGDPWLSSSDVPTSPTSLASLNKSFSRTEYIISRNVTHIGHIGTHIWVAGITKEELHRLQLFVSKFQYNKLGAFRKKEVGIKDFIPDFNLIKQNYINLMNTTEASNCFFTIPPAFREVVFWKAMQGLLAVYIQKINKKKGEQIILPSKNQIPRKTWFCTDGIYWFFDREVPLVNTQIESICKFFSSSPSDILALLPKLEGREVKITKKYTSVAVIELEEKARSVIMDVPDLIYEKSHLPRVSSLSPASVSSMPSTAILMPLSVPVPALVIASSSAPVSVSSVSSTAVPTPPSVPVSASLVIASSSASVSVSSMPSTAVPTPPSIPVSTSIAPTSSSPVEASVSSNAQNLCEESKRPVNEEKLSSLDKNKLYLLKQLEKTLVEDSSSREKDEKFQIFFTMLSGLQQLGSHVTFPAPSSYSLFAPTMQGDVRCGVGMGAAPI